jgi:hypothetical protein
MSDLRSDCYVEVICWAPKFDVPSVDNSAADPPAYITECFNNYYGNAAQTIDGTGHELNVRIQNLPTWRTKFRKVKTWRMRLKAGAENWIVHKIPGMRTLDHRMIFDQDWQLFRRLTYLYTWRVQGPLVFDKNAEGVPNYTNVSTANCNVMAHVYSSVKFGFANPGVNKGYITNTVSDVLNDPSRVVDEEMKENDPNISGV